MKEIKINITKARIRGFTVAMNDPTFPSVSATIDLLTDGGKIISTYEISSNHWLPEKKFDLPIDMIFPLGQIASQLERIVTEHCEYSTLRIVGPAMENAIPAESDVPF